ncbi:MAG: coenzyme F420-0:L-glutamate ligase [Candidatus Marinimicrobia bacterium]|nr:coenzyme F420-0:L-glutamate ligase [Candidatus Neomarinimicrobiota bacterium]
MGRYVGTVVRGIRMPIIRQGDALESMVVERILQTSHAEGFSIRNKDVVGITESIVARSQGNYASIDNIVTDLSEKFQGAPLGVVFPILSRNRFSILLRAIAKSTHHVFIQLSYPSDEVGNPLISPDLLDEKAVNPWTDTFTEEEFQTCFGKSCHPFTGIDYLAYYRSLVEDEGTQCTFLFSNQPQTICDMTHAVLVCDIHNRFRTKRFLKDAGAEIVYGLDDILTKPIKGSGYNPDFGLLGSNKATEETVKLFPRECQSVVNGIQAQLKEKTGKTVEVLIYGDGAFKDPVAKIWELADPVVSPGYTSGLEGTSNEVKIKYLADNQFSTLSGQALNQAIVEQIQKKKEDLKSAMESQGTTPRRLTDLLGSLCDLTSGSGDKGTPVIYIQGYFDSYASE